MEESPKLNKLFCEEVDFTATKQEVYFYIPKFYILFFDYNIHENTYYAISELRYIQTDLSNTFFDNVVYKVMDNLSDKVPFKYFTLDIDTGKITSVDSDFVESSIKL